MEWPLSDNMWDNALRPGRGRGPTRNLKQLAERLGWIPALGGWTCNGQSCVLKWRAPDLKEDRKAALNAALGGVWHEERAHSAVQVGDICVRCGEEVENLEHIVLHRLHCPHWNKERREACLPSHTAVAPACVRLHGLLPAPGPGLLPAHEPALVSKAGVNTVWTDGLGKHSSNPHFRRCGVGYVTDTGER
eukprot:4439128-Amphidinium_carterae.1